jgi:hypothetical protein
MRARHEARRVIHWTLRESRRNHAASGMRLFLEILLIGLLAFVGWRQPFRDMVRTRFPQTDIAPSRLALRALEAEHWANMARARSRGYAPPSSGSWMYNERGALDPNPKPK